MLYSEAFCKTGLPETQAINIQAFWDSTVNWFFTVAAVGIFECRLKRLVLPCMVCWAERCGDASALRVSALQFV